MPVRRPLIGVTTTLRGGWRGFLFNRMTLRLAGAEAKRLHAAQKHSVAGLHGLVIGGGDDIGSELYGGKPVPDIRIDPARDELELELLEQADANHLPVLGICRGAQMLNVHRGGALHTDVHEIYETAPRGRTILPLRQIKIEPDSRLSALMGRRLCRANVLHHQSISRLGRGLHAVAHDSFGIVQAIEMRGHRFLFGVQWHPELLFYSPPHLRLFQALVSAARGG
ncbi:MAG TPA: gamma-glutamyl-gamma-aminobutyrate hydrolase family protein [Kiloniellales bacterium]|nr:gamma-glutamyl-gamma-aminobutyrate hydrolase family protein [Kiloniellales bacterium]